MQPTTSQSAATPIELVVARALSGFSEIVNAALRDFATWWRERQECKLDRLPAAFAHMDVRMLRDIGAPEWLVDRATAERQQWQRLARYLRWPPTE